MIARIWHGWTTPASADAYERLLRERVLPGIHDVDGHEGAYLLRNDGEAEVEFVTVTLFTDLDAVRRFAGDDLTLAVVPPEARSLLARFDERSVHYGVVEGPAGAA